ncbi:TolB family protein [Bacillus rhizoplanae]|uniref:TolB family protein n=1 Tax=Bacillus rhizoplanae TaxID=2880966 RepID=UPI003D1D2778
MGIRILLVILVFFSFSTIASAEAPLRAAFIRNHQLWIKERDKETPLTKDRHVCSPQWSNDGRFIAYLDGDEHATKTYLFIYDSKQKESYQPYETIETIETRNFQWSPISNQLAYNAGGVLNITKTKNGRPKGFENVSLGVSHFAWFPNGKELSVKHSSSSLNK